MGSLLSLTAKKEAKTKRQDSRLDGLQAARRVRAMNGSNQTAAYCAAALPFSPSVHSFFLRKKKG